MTLNQAMSAGAIAFAAFAAVVYFRTKKNVNGGAAVQPGQAQRDAGLAEWNTQQVGIVDYITNVTRANYEAELTRKLNP